MRIFIAKNLLSRTHNQLTLASLLICFVGHSHVVSAQITNTNKIESAQAVSPDELPSMEELIDLVGPIALFPDDLLALTLEAASYPIEIVSANRMKKNPKKPSMYLNIRILEKRISLKKRKIYVARMKSLKREVVEDKEITLIFVKEDLAAKKNAL